MLSNLIDICTKKNIVFPSKISIMVDFEFGMISALNKVFAQQINILGYNF